LAETWDIYITGNQSVPGGKETVALLEKYNFKTRNFARISMEMTE
jgi:hypothetical protein